MPGEGLATARDELVLGRYRPLQPLGSGGTGSVWLARDEELGIEVALKIVRREGNAHARAKREAAAAARLRHERCVRAYAFGADAEHVYIASEYVRGRTLRHALRAGELGDADAIEAAAQILDGLAHAHAHGIVHRDVKPSNVLLADSSEISVRVLDFGLALMHEAETLTAVGDVPGTLAYISPERLRGRTACAASDVWAVGVLLWEALAGEHPFWSGSLLETGRRIQAGAPSLGEMRPDLPRRLVAAVDRALARDPAKRPPAARLAAALRASFRGGELYERAARRQVGVQPQAALAGVLAALFAGWTTAALPFFPATWPVGLGLLAGLTALVRPRLGLALALAGPVFPLGNVARGAALLYLVIALLWLAVFARRPREALGFVLGPALALGGAVALLPLVAAQTVGGFARRFLQAALGVLAAGLVAGVRETPLPLTAAEPPHLVGLQGSNGLRPVGGVVVDAIGARPELAVGALVFGAAAALLPRAAAAGSGWLAAWGIAVFAALDLPFSLASPLAVGLALAASCLVGAATAAAEPGERSASVSASASVGSASGLEPPEVTVLEPSTAGRGVLPAR